MIFIVKLNLICRTLASPSGSESNLTNIFLWLMLRRCLRWLLSLVWLANFSSVWSIKNFSRTLPRFQKHTHSCCILLGPHWEHCHLVWKNLIEIAKALKALLTSYLCSVWGPHVDWSIHTYSMSREVADFGCTGRPVKPQSAFLTHQTCFIKLTLCLPCFQG